MVQDVSKLSTHGRSWQYGRSEPGRDGQDLHGENTDVTVFLATSLVQFLQKLHVGIEPDPDAVEEKNWELGCRGVRSIPVAYILGGRVLGRNESVRPRRKDLHRVQERSTVELKTVKA